MGLKWLNALTLLVMLGFNVLANTLPLNGQTTRDISDRLGILLTPADYTFAIWGLIYSLLVMFIVMLWISDQGDDVVERLGYSLIASHLFNMSWLVFFHYEWFGLALLAIIGLWISLWVVYKRLDDASLNPLWRVPISIYFAWVTVATLISIAIVLDVNQWLTWVSPTVVTLGLIWLAAMLAVLWLGRNGEIIFPLVVIWALVGIALNRQDYPVIAYTALAMAGLLAIVTVLYGFTSQSFEGEE
ncbi:hypothetical protein ABID56_001403 [Alkalibacillus flavidus]|uniref:Tryptophan-rich sensory protein n=1 Tax=Alkalibacillus flavidus TaxID=546021 RepID=A0ABV2KUQ0_9BACI